MSLTPPVGSNDYIQGSPDAAAVLVEYGDYQCPYCGEAFEYVKQAQQQFGDRMAFVFRNFPIPELHPQAMPAATTAMYCGNQGKFWQAHDALYENQQQLGDGLYEQLVQELGLSVDGLKQALSSGEFTQRIQDDIDSGLRSGVNGTPSFFLNGQKLELTSGFGDISAAIAEVLGE